MDRWERGADREDFPSVWSLPEYIQYRICCAMTSRVVLIVSGVLGVLFQVCPDGLIQRWEYRGSVGFGSTMYLYRVCYS
jgi:hypothetical protein